MVGFSGDADHFDWNSTWRNSGRNINHSETHLFFSAPMLRRLARLHLLGQPAYRVSFTGASTELVDNPYSGYDVYYTPGSGARDLFHQPMPLSGLTDSNGAISPIPGPQPGYAWTRFEYASYPSPWVHDSIPLTMNAATQLADFNFQSGNWVGFLPGEFMQFDVETLPNVKQSSNVLSIQTPSTGLIPLGLVGTVLGHPTSTSVLGQCLVALGSSTTPASVTGAVAEVADTVVIDRITSW